MPTPGPVSPTPPVTGTCGGGQIGNGVCADPTLCCSQYGWCDISPAHCADSPPTPPPQPVAPPPPTPPTPPVSGEHDDSRLIAYLGNWQSCPTADQVAQYTHIVIAFAVSYTWSPSKNICSQTCDITEPPICNNAPNPGLVSEWQAAGKKVILSFGGAGMGGSWAGDNNDCWDYCFGREQQVVTRLTDIVNNMGLDGIDIDYEYFYDSQHQIDFLRDITVGMRNSLGPNKIVTHAPMEPDIVPGSAYFDLFVELAPFLDFVMPQYYNGYTRPATDGFDGGAVSAEAHYTAIVDQIFDGDATKIIFGFCITGCLGSATGDQAAAVMSQVNGYYECNGGAYFWVVFDDTGGAWSRAVSAVVAPNAGCSGPPTTPAPTEPTTAAPTNVPTQPQPTIGPTFMPTPGPVSPTPPISPPPTDPATMCCPKDYTGLKKFGDCSSYYHCVGGIVTGGLLACSAGTLFDESLQFCNWIDQVQCDSIFPCGNTPPTATPVEPPTFAPTKFPTALPTPALTKLPTPTPVVIPTEPPAPAPTEPPTPAPVSAPTPETKCCPDGYSGLRAYDSCTEYYHCVYGHVTGDPLPCPAGTLFDSKLQICNWASQVQCESGSCGSTSIAPTPTPPDNEEMCCSPGQTGLRPYDSCKKYYHCVSGAVTGGALACPPGTLFNANLNVCDWESAVQCNYEYCPSSTQ